MKELNVNELLKNTYSNLEKRNSHEKIKLTDLVYTEIADDSDWHRTRKGYMRYEKVDIFDFGKQWLLGCGENCGSYPARPYDSDILALEISNENKPINIQKEIEEKIHLSSYFRNSLIYGYADGNLGISKSGRFGKRMRETIKPKVSEFIAQKPEYDSQYLELSTLLPVNTKEMLYKPVFVDFLTEAIEDVLKEESKKEAIA